MIHLRINSKQYQNKEKEYQGERELYICFYCLTALTHNTIQRLTIALNLNLKERNAEKKSYSFIVHVY